MTAFDGKFSKMFKRITNIFNKSRQLESKKDRKKFKVAHLPRLFEVTLDFASSLSSDFDFLVFAVLSSFSPAFTLKHELHTMAVCPFSRTIDSD